MSRILVINPGSKSTKIAMYEDHSQLWQQDIEHDAEEINSYATIYSQLDMRAEAVTGALRQHNEKLEDLTCIMSRGGLLPPLPSGAYEVNEEMLDVLEHRPINHHASNLGAAIAYRLAVPLGIKAYIYDPVTVDEMIEIARITGIKQIRRHGQGHNLNMRAAALKYCKDNGLDYYSLNLIAVQLGGGITLTLHSNGRIIDMVSDDEGPFSSERCGLIPGYKLVKYAYLEDRNYISMMKLMQRQAGLISLIGEGDVRKVEERVKNGDEEARLAYEAMALGVAKGIANLSVVVDGKVDQIILTGGIAHSEYFTGMIRQRVEFIAPVYIIPGENEMQALADGACRVLSGEETAKEYREPDDRPF